MKEFVFCTLRDNKGATGGPGGVLFLQKKMLGKSINGVPLSFQFNFFKGGGSLTKFANTICFVIKYFTKWNAYFVTHDVRTAVLLSMMKKKYSLIFHHQGPLVEELINLGVVLSESEIAKKSSNERKAFLNAQSLHFPSKGAAEMYFKSKYASSKIEEVRLGRPLYNVIPLVEVKRPSDLIINEPSNALTFFSLGTLTLAKGQDQSVDFIKNFLSMYEKPVKYIIVGKGPLKETLLEKLKEMQELFKHFTFDYYESLSHDTVMYLHKVSDIYIMLHRISIFDFATLEAMSQGSAIVLSKVGGNTELNLDDNVVFAEDVADNMMSFVNMDFSILKKKNQKVFNEHFSPSAFKKQYEVFLSSIEHA